MAAITNFENIQSLFAGQNDIVLFTQVGSTTGEINYAATSSLADLKAPKSLGQIVQDSTSWDGDDVTVDEIKDEQGDLITARVTAGTLAFSFELASTSKAMIEKFLNGAGLTTAAVTGVDGFTSAGVQATGFGIALPVFTAPIMVLNDEANRALLFPKAKITSNLSLSDGLWRIKASVLAEYIETAPASSASGAAAVKLTTGMMLEGKADYGA